MILSFFYYFFILCCATAHKNVLIFMVDDMGINDLHYFNTPYIRKLASEGITLSNHYTAITCTPSRASFLTGKYPANTGLTSALLYNNPYGLRGHDTIATILQKKGYFTSLIGKWHLGYARKEYLPIANGFGYFFGTVNGATDHYNKKVNNIYDLYENTIPIINSTYSTELYTDKTLSKLKEPFFTMVSYQALHTPLQVPKRYLKKCHIKNRFRRLYCGMLIAVDKSIQIIVERLKAENKWHNTLILFLTDNGGQPFYGASNYPYRGAKNSVFEGGTKGVAFLSGGVVYKSFTYSGLVHISDWFPSILYYTGVRYSNNSTIDGINIFNNIIFNSESLRKEMLIHYDIYSNSYCYREGDWKIIVGNTGDSSLFGIYDSKWCSINNLPIDKLVCFFNYIIADKYFFIKELVRELRNLITRNSIGGDVIFKFVNRDSAPISLYNIKYDPYELNDLSVSHTNIKERLLKKINNISIIHPQYPWFISDSNAKNIKYKGKIFHSPWINTENYKISKQNFIIYIVIKGILKLVVFFVFLWFFLKIFF